MTAPAIQIEPFYLDSPRDCLFCIFTAPSKQLLKGPVLDLRRFFTEEIHNSRRMAALQALYDDQTDPCVNGRKSGALQTMKLFIKHFTLFALVLASGMVFAQQAKVSKEELKSLPSFCKGTQLIRDVSGDTTPFGVYKQMYGRDFMHLHHYCWGLNIENNYHRNRSSTYWQGMLPYAISEMDYVIKNSSSTFLFLPDVYFAKARIYLLQRQNGAALTAALKAIELKPDYVAAYTFVSDLYEKIGNKSNAIKTLESAFLQAPESTSILRRLKRLGVTPPKREPTAPQLEEAPAQPSPNAAEPPSSPIAAPAIAPLEQPSPPAPATAPFIEPATQQTNQDLPHNPHCRFCP